MSPPPLRKQFPWWAVGFVGLLVIVALFTFVSSKAGMRGLGVVTLSQATVHLISRRIPYGWEGRQPSGYITGTAAVIVAALLALLGLAMLAKPELMLVLFGWAEA